MRYANPPDQVRVRWVQDGTNTVKRKVEVEPGWHRVWVTIKGDQRDPGEGIVQVKVEADDYTIARPFWQR